jgi:uncharacterized DUF497 family protein
MIRFEWDPAKAAANIRKHQISFEEAKSVFYDEFALQFFDEEHSSDEERFLMLGMSSDAKRLSSVIASASMAKSSASSQRAKQPNEKALSIKVVSMKAEYDLSKLKSRKNPYASKLKKPVTMRLSEDVVTYFKGMADEAGIPYQSLINLYLRDCIATHRKVQIKWPQTA